MECYLEVWYRQSVVISHQHTVQPFQYLRPTISVKSKLFIKPVRGWHSARVCIFYIPVQYGYELN